MSRWVRGESQPVVGFEELLQEAQDLEVLRLLIMVPAVTHYRE